MSPRFKRRLERKPTQVQVAILECIDRLADDPRHPGLHTHKVRGYEGVWEAYVDRSNRLTFEYRNGRIWLRNHCSHDVLRTP